MLASTGRRVVLIDDDEDQRFIFHAVLERNGHHVRDAANGLAGVALIVADPPDVAIIDITLPEMDGYEVARRIRAAVGATVRLVALTGYAQDAIRVQAMEAGFDEIMTKPVDMAVVEAVLTRGGLAQPS